MKYRIFLISIVLSTIFYSCKKDNQEEQARTVTCTPHYSEYKILENYKIDTISTSEICTGYFNIWKKIFKEQNNISDSFFNEHIIIRSYALESWNHGVSYRVRYYFQMGWATVSVSDKFMVKIYSSSNHYQNLPREVYLSEEEIRNEINQFSLYSRITTFSTSD